MRGVTYPDVHGRYDMRKFQLTRLMRGVTVLVVKIFGFKHISTHTPHARRDALPCVLNMVHDNFNSHASCEA